MSMPSNTQTDVTPSKAKVSVIVPVKNSAATLAQTLASIRAQTLTEWEAWIVDDQSEDSSLEIACAASATDPRIHTIRNPGRGVSAARNAGAARAQGELLAFIDADDTWLPQKLSTHVQRFDSDPTLGLAFDRIRFTRPDGKPTAVTSTVPRGRVQAASLLYENPACTASTLVVRRAAFEEAGGFDTALARAEDLELMLRVACRTAWCLRAVPSVLTHYRSSANGASADLEGMQASWERVIESVAHYAPGLVAAHHKGARAIHLRYLARRALRLNLPPQKSADLLKRAWRESPLALARSPYRSIGTAVATAALAWRTSESRPASPGFEADARQRAADATLVSVIVPAYNASRFIDGAIDTVLAQKHRRFEMLIIDDGSTDDTAERVHRRHDPRIQLIQQANRGLAGARNTGIRAARGELLAFLDADDRWHPEKLSQHVAHLTSKPEVGVSYSASELIDDDEQPLGIRQQPKLSGVSARDVFLRNPVGNGSAPVIRREVMAKIGFASPHDPAETWYFDETLRQSEDIECWMRIALTTNWKFEGLAMPLTLYRVNAGGLSANLEKQLQTWEGMVERASRLNPEFVKSLVGAARAYQLRYLARRAVRLLDGKRALALMWRATRLHPGLWVEEPARSTLTLAAASFCWAVPKSVYEALEAAVRPWVGRCQKAMSR
jgi:glycosyltransferase involved in cell wall biosynthesis